MTIILLKERELNSHNRGYYAYIMKLNLSNIQLQLKNAILWLVNYQKQKLVDSQKLFYFMFVEAMKSLANLKLLGKD